MILLVHMLLGALIGQMISSPIFAVILAFFSHYFLDVFPHIEYSIKNIKDKRWGKSLPDILKVFLDFLIGVILISIFSENNFIVYISAFSSILPDGLSILGSIFKNRISDSYNQFHQEKLHFLRDKKISFFWRVLSQAVVILICIILFKT